MGFIYLILAAVFGSFAIWLAKTNIRLKSSLRGRRHEIENLNRDIRVLKGTNERYKDRLEIQTNEHNNQLSTLTKKITSYEEIVIKDKAKAHFEVHELKGKFFDIDVSFKLATERLQSKEEEILSLTSESDSQKKIILRLEVQNKSLQQVFENVQRNHQECIKQVKELEVALSIKDELYKCLENKSNESISKITLLYSDYLLIQYDISEKYLREKKNPARIEAQRINDLKLQSKQHIEKYKQMLYKYEYMLQLFPELTYYVDDFKTIQQLEQVESIQNLEEDFDRVAHYVNKDEYGNLSVDERNQLALDRYIKGQKTNWQIGRDYELFCGRFYEENNWRVEYCGMEKKLNDMGRDLICQKGNDVYVVQCKLWSQNKTIHEKHIVQLYGTTIAYAMDVETNKNVIPVFITNTKLSDTALSFAKKLNVIVLIKEFQEFPRIKCNVSRDEYGLESRIYHLPFDQQYDRTQINKKGELYAFTIKDAVEKGFRRAYKYYG